MIFGVACTGVSVQASWIKVWKVLMGVDEPSVIKYGSWYIRLMKKKFPKNYRHKIIS